MSYGSISASKGSTKGPDTLVQSSQVGDDVESGIMTPPVVGEQAEESLAEHGDEQHQTTTIWQKFKGFYERNIGLFFVFLAQVFASLEPFTVKEAIAGLIAFSGVLFIARPTFLFPQHKSQEPGINGTRLFMVNQPRGLVPSVPATPAERTVAALLAVIGTFGAAAAYSTIRVIGKRAHSLVSVNYFAVLATVGSFVIILVVPGLEFKIPQTLTQWALLIAIGIAGFLLQFLLTEGLQREKAGRATNLIYTQMVFALILERIVWGTTPPVESLFGSALIIGSAIWVSLQKSKTATRQKAQVVDEEQSLLGAGAPTENRES
ncbi:hypothetical protein Daesc_008178 [Daldinia eschscholtzii]|uniref:EamA domain-containing protein n=1 Tax=Daldinia eschscholtzii TaxID=292717 RepID=A0AAX6MB27_9PEZI